MKKICFLLVFLGYLGMQVAYAQTRDISGTVTSVEDGGPIPGASVVVKGSTIGTITDMDGRFTLKITQTAKTITVSFVGMATVDVQLTAANTYNVALAPSQIAVDEVVVTAFGMKRERKGLGYAVQDVKNEELTRTGSSSFSTALQGKLAGVEIKPSSGMPGASTQITIRGARSFSDNNQPLYVVDGMPVASNADYSTGNSVTGTDIANRAVDIDPNDIESVNILKGQAAAALYGIRASNGVVVITTKSGKGVKKG
ncbi:MAG TPA: TonB-dependent receptor plug domain-containing protein, partial [Prolixibacteraceae bacterium]|nr:TonB-dependent receptor plug domain-containing protein [Prolixibacteraceae bacterium]